MTTLSLVYERGDVSLPDLADASDRSRSAISRHVEELEAADAVEPRLDGQTKVDTLSQSGAVLIDATRKRIRGARGQPDCT